MIVTYTKANGTYWSVNVGFIVFAVATAWCINHAYYDWAALLALNTIYCIHNDVRKS